MENFPWQLTDYGKISLVSRLPLEKNLATSRIVQAAADMEKEFSPEKIHLETFLFQFYAFIES